MSECVPAVKSIRIQQAMDRLKSERRSVRFIFLSVQTRAKSIKHCNETRGRLKLKPRRLKNEPSAQVPITAGPLMSTGAGFKSESVPYRIPC